jgi:Zn-dependent protease with chaperone function
MAEKRGEDAVSFVVAHELAHLKRGHLKWRWLLLPARIIPFLFGAYSRACEYTCDQFGAAVVPSGAVNGLLALAAGGELYEQVEPRLFAGQAETEDGFWTTIRGDLCDASASHQAGWRGAGQGRGSSSARGGQRRPVMV